MINTRYFIDDELVDMSFDNIESVINSLSLLYLDRTHKKPRLRLCPMNCFINF
jgi:hypothetical protein